MELPAIPIPVTLCLPKCSTKKNIAVILISLSSQTRWTLSKISSNFHLKSDHKCIKTPSTPRKSTKIIQMEKSSMRTKKTRLTRSRIRFEMAKKLKKSLFSCTPTTIRLINQFSFEKKIFFIFIKSVLESFMR